MQVNIYSNYGLNLYVDDLVIDSDGYLDLAHAMPIDDDLADAIGAALMAYQDHGIMQDNVLNLDGSCSHFWIITE